MNLTVYGCLDGEYPDMAQKTGLPPVTPSTVPLT